MAKGIESNDFWNGVWLIQGKSQGSRDEEDGLKEVRQGKIGIETRSEVKETMIARKGQEAQRVGESSQRTHFSFLQNDNEKAEIGGISRKKNVKEVTSSREWRSVIRKK